MCVAEVGVDVYGIEVEDASEWWPANSHKGLSNGFGGS
jgi:hypothetical protein